MIHRKYTAELQKPNVFTPLHQYMKDMTFL